MVYNLKHITYLLERESVTFGRVYTVEGEKEYNFQVINVADSAAMKAELMRISTDAPGVYWVLLRKTKSNKDEYFRQEVELKSYGEIATVSSAGDVERIVTERITAIKKGEEIEILKSENEELKTGAGKLAYLIEVLVEKLSVKFVSAPAPVLQGVPENKNEMTENEKGQYILKSLLNVYTLDETVKIVHYLIHNETARKMVELYALKDHQAKPVKKVASV
jgi:hypothetical protein